MANLKGGTIIGGYRAVHTGNIVKVLKARDGHGSGIDADMLDGRHASDFSSSSHNHDSQYVKKSGDTMTGNLTINNDSGVSVRGEVSLKISSNCAKIAIDGSASVYNNGFSIEGPSSTKLFRLDSSGNGYLANGGRIVTRGDYGHGKGLDADMLDGIQGDCFVNGINSTCVTPVSSIDNIWKSGFYDLDGESGAPVSGQKWWWILKLGHRNNNPSNRYGTVIAGQNGADELYFRNADTSGTANWCRIWHSRNQGHNSGLDADRIDGLHLGDLDNRFVRKSGDTMTNTLTINSELPEALALKSRTSDHVYLSMFPRNNSNQRGCYIGYGDRGRTALDIFNHIGDVNIVSSSSSVYINSIRFDNSDRNPSSTNRLNIDAYVHATRFYGAVYNDYAEYFEKDKNEEFEPGDLICLDDSSDEEVYIKSKKPYSPNVVGVYSDEYAQCIGGKGDGKDEENYLPIGLAGRVRVKVIGKVSKGDLLVSSGVEGYAMASTKYIPGTVIGKALENKTSIGKGKVRMLINLQ